MLAKDEALKNIILFERSENFDPRESSLSQILKSLKLFFKLSKIKLKNFRFFRLERTSGVASFLVNKNPTGL